MTWTAEDVRQRLAGYQGLALPPFGRRESSVLIPLVERDGELHVILTKRAATLKAHAGEISFPGGGTEPGDADSYATAQREAWEEIRLVPEACEHVATLDDSPTVTGYKIRPHVVLVRQADGFRRNGEEVDRILEVPLSVFMAAGGGYEFAVERGRMRGSFPLYPYCGNIIWGATARILAGLVRALGGGVQSSFDAVLRAFVPRVMAARKVVLTTHMNPDPDGLGAQIALEEMLLALGKEVLIANHDAIPERYQHFLSFRSPCVIGNEILESHARGADLLVVVDTAEVARIGKASRLLAAFQERIAVLDHHLAGNLRGDAVLVDRTYSSASEIVYSVLSQMGFPLSKRAVDALYAGLQFDTHGFRYVDNRAEPFRIAGHLVALGADASTLQEHLFASVSPGHVAALGVALQRARTEFDGQWMWSWITQQELDSIGADDEDAGDIAPFFNTIGSVKISTFLRELPDGRFKVAFRSKRERPIGGICAALGGGGHANAGGATVSGPVEKIAARVRDEVEKVLAR